MTARAMRSRCMVLLVVLAGCGPDRLDPPHAAPARPVEAPSPEAAPPHQDAPTPDAPTVTPAAAPLPASGCAFAAPVRLHDASGWTSVAPLDGAFVVGAAVRAGDGEQVLVWRVEADGSARELARAALEHGAPDHRRSAPALATSSARIAIALPDGRARLLFAELEGSTLGWRVLADAASLRFAPALAADERGWTLAFTEERDEAMRVRAGRVERGELRAARELRPEAGGSAATCFVAGAAPPLLVFLDPRAGVSVAYRASPGDHGLGDPRVARPLNLLTEPPEIAAVQIGGAPWLAYTSVGSAATTAVGLLPLSGEAPPSALVAGTGYGVLHVDAAPLPGDRAVFVADAPRAAPPDSPRELHVRVAARDGTLGEPAVVRGPSDAASRGRIAHAGQGVVAVVFTDEHAIYAAIGRCAAP